MIGVLTSGNAPGGGVLDMVLCQIPTISPSNPGGGGGVGEWGDAIDRCITV